MTKEIKTPQGNDASYADLRLAEYPSVYEQLDILYHKGFEQWKAIIKEVKEKYPKE